MDSIDFYLTIFSLVGGVVAFLYQLFKFMKNQQWQNIILTIFLIITTSCSVYFYYKIDVKYQISKQANQLLEYRKGNMYPQYSDAEFIMAALSFLEKNKEIYPDAYVRAEKICANNYCMKPQYKNDDSEYSSYDYSSSIGNAAELIEGILRGIAILER